MNKITYFFGVIALIVCLLIVFGACSSTPRTQIEKIDTKIEQKGAVGTESIGINEKNEAVIQEKLILEDKIRKLKWQNAEDEEKLKSMHGQLIHCQKDLANPLLDGSGEMPEIPEVDAAMDFSKQRTSLGIDEKGSLVVLTKELVQDRLNREERYHENLVSNNNIVKKQLDKCLFKMGIVRQKKGLQPTWYFRDPMKGHELETDLGIGFKNAERDKKLQQ